MPAISDPGEVLVRQCHELGIPVESVPGPCAFATALAISGMPSGRFTFEGFLSVNKTSRFEHLNSLKNETRTMIFYEAPHKLAATLKDMASVFGSRETAVVRELTKIHEQVIRTTLDSAARHFAENTAKGEFVIIVKGCETAEIQEQMTFEQALRTREFEDDAPNFTPRISGIIHLENGDMNYAMSILKSADGDGSSCQRYTFAYSNPLPGKAKFIHTYKCDGNPLPSFEGEPKTLELPDVDIDELTNIIWENLNADNKVSLFVRYIDLETGKYESRIVNKNK